MSYFTRWLRTWVPQQKSPPKRAFGVSLRALSMLNANRHLRNDGKPLLSVTLLPKSSQRIGPTLPQG